MPVHRQALVCPLCEILTNAVFKFITMRKLLVILFLFIHITIIHAQRGFNYYKDSSRVGSPNKKAYTYFKKAYYDCIWTWTRAGADSAEYYLKLAIQEDSNYAAAYAFLAHVYQFKSYDNQEFDKKFALQKKVCRESNELASRNRRCLFCHVRCGMDRTRYGTSTESFAKSNSDGTR